MAAAKSSTTGNGAGVNGKAPKRGVKVANMDPHSKAASELAREKFLPVTRQALMDRLTSAKLWPDGQAAQARRFLRYLDYWRRHSYTMRLLEIEQTYEPFSPDSDLLHTRTYSADEKFAMRKRLVQQMIALLQQGNFTRVNPEDVHFILTKDSHYGLDLQVDLSAFEEVLIYYRGATTISERRRDIKKVFIGWKEVRIPVFQRLFLLFKLKPLEQRIDEVRREKKISRKEAEKIVRTLRAQLPPTVSSDYIYMKLFKNMPRSDVEMIFPNTKVRFRMFDKIKFGFTASSGLGMGAVGTATKVAVASNPYTLAAAVAGLGGVAVRQAANFINQRNRYMIVMARNLYFHSMADNRGVITLLADRAAEEDGKEEMLLYSVLAKERVNVRDLTAVDQAIEAYLTRTFGFTADFDIEDALERLRKDGIVAERPDGTLEALAPEHAARRIDVLWDACLDELPDLPPPEGQEIDPEPEAPTPSA